MFRDVTYFFIFIVFTDGLQFQTSEPLAETSTEFNEHIEKIPLENDKFLNLKGLNLTTIEDIVWKDYESVEIIDASDNPIGNIGILNSKTIKEIHLSNVSLRWIPSGSFRGLSRIETIILNNNVHLTTLEITSKSLINLEVAHCSLSEISFPLTESLKYLNLSHNRITRVEDGAFAFNLNLEKIDLSNNDIDSIFEYVFIKLPHLMYLDLSANKISRTEWTMTLKNLEYLNVNNNEIDNIDVLMLRNVNFLNISSNKLTEIPEELGRLLPKLEVLDARSNPIRQIKRLKSNSLKKLYISECKIRAINIKAFEELPQITILDVSDNKLDNFMFITSLGNTTEVILHDNPWNCLCNMAIRVSVYCQPQNLLHEEYCTLFTEKPQDAWFLEAANPVIWAPLIVALVIVIVACVGCRYCKKMMRYRNGSLEEAPVDLVHDMQQTLLKKGEK